MQGSLGLVRAPFSLPRSAPTTPIEVSRVGSDGSMQTATAPVLAARSEAAT